MAAFEWSEDQIAKLVKMWDLGASAASCAKQLGVTRNAVIGKIHRLRNGGYAFNRQKMNPVQAALSRPPRKPRLPRERLNEDNAMLARVRAAAKAAKAAKAEPKKVRDIPEAVPVIIDASFAKPWLERSFGECAYPIGGDGADTVSCCAPNQLGSSYCAGHHRRMFYKPQQVGAKYEKRFAKIAA
jgi:GcrA cell cycle regulator